MCGAFRAEPTEGPGLPWMGCRTLPLAPHRDIALLPTLAVMLCLPRPKTVEGKPPEAQTSPREWESNPTSPPSQCSCQPLCHSDAKLTHTTVLSSERRKQLNESDHVLLSLHLLADSLDKSQARPAETRNLAVEGVTEVCVWASRGQLITSQHGQAAQLS